MKRFLAFIVLLATGCAQQPGQRAPPGPEEARLTARVVDIKWIWEYSGPITIADLDPAFALTLDIRSVHPDVPGFAAKQIRTFAVHSQANLFPGDNKRDIVGHTFDFTLSRMHDGKYFIGPLFATKRD